MPSIYTAQKMLLLLIYTLFIITQSETRRDLVSTNLSLLL